MENNGYDPVAVRNTPNSYALPCAAKMFPLPGVLKRLLLALREKAGLANWRLRLPAGNMVSVGPRKREAALPCQPA
jgi:hypothetical protein